MNYEFSFGSVYLFISSICDKPYKNQFLYLQGLFAQGVLLKYHQALKGFVDTVFPVDRKEPVTP